ncbi:MAG: pyruvate dehydrogenase E2 component (dihydrolipoamide acetyltransferase) [Paracoccaceae bacterium]|jgi:pyruvate dehydrogenase E2 component (dihydrolipoamide acetyltransferase)
MDVIMPQLGETVAEGTVSVWHKTIGDTVSTKEPLFDVSSDKVEMEVPAPAEGTLLEIRVDAGVTVPVGEIVAIIVREGEVIEVGAGIPEKAAEVAPKAAAAAPVRDVSVKAANRDANGNPLSPAVRRLVAENNLDPVVITGSGLKGRIKKKDVLAYLATGARPAPGRTISAPPPLSFSADDTEVIPFSKLRKLTAEHMVRSKATSPHVLQAVEADFARVARARTGVSGAWKKREGFSLTYLPFIAKAVCEAIREFPRVNGAIDGENLVVFRRVNLGIAVDLDFDGLVAPVIKDADQMSLQELARAIRDVSERARTNQLKPDDFTEGTYTISNSGVFGTMITAPIINQPQVAILSTDGITKKPVVIETEDGDTIGIRPVGVLAQSFDHRAIDGAYSAAFLNRVREILQTKDWSTVLS